MRLIENRKIIWLVGTVFIVLAPHASDLYDELIHLFLAPTHFMDTYGRSFDLSYAWIFRIAAIYLNVKIAKNRQSDPKLILWIIFSLFLPGFSLVIHGFLMGKDRNKNIKQIKWLFYFCAAIIVMLFAAGVTQNYIRSYQRDKAVEEFQIDGLDSLIIMQIDSIATSLDTSKTEYYRYNDVNKTLEKAEIGKDYSCFVGSSIGFQKDSLGRIRYSYEESDEFFKSTMINFYNEDGVVVLREYCYHHPQIDFDLDANEYIREYYTGNKLLKRTYRLVALDGRQLNPENYGLSVRYSFTTYNTIKEFEKIFRLTGNE